MSSSQVSKQKRGCVFWGCLTAGILFLGAGGCTALVLFSLRNLVLSYTVEEPAPLPIAELGPGQIDQIQRRVEQYQAAVQENQPAELSLTAGDINALIAQAPELAGRAYVDIVGDEITAEGSIPLQGIPGLSDRYLNASFSILLSLQNETLLASITDFDIEGKTIPADFKRQVLAELQDIDVTKEMDDPEAVRQLLNAVDRLEIRDSQLVLIRE